MEHFQWKTTEESRDLDAETFNEVKDEIGDTLVYLLRLCDELNIDPIKAANEKMLKNIPWKKPRGNQKNIRNFKIIIIYVNLL